MRRKQQGPRWAPSHIFVREDGTVVHSQREYVGYGFTSYNVVGTREGVLEAYNQIKRGYPPQGYGGYYPEPVEFVPGLFIGYPRHSESCE
jgi:hypothetical protein